MRKVIIALLAIMCLANPARAQWADIPNSTGTGAGQTFRNSINAIGSGAKQIAPRIANILFASLPTEQDGQQFWLTNGSKTNPCTGGGTGAMAIGDHGAWNCLTGATSGAGSVTTFSAPNGLVVINPTTTPQLTIPNNTQYAAGLAGATAYDKIIACLAAVPTNGGVCDAQGLTGSQSLNNTTVAIPGSKILLIGQTHYTNAGNPAFTMGVHAALVGLGTIGNSGGPSRVDLPTGGTGVRGAGNLGDGNSMWTVQGMDFVGVSDSDGSIGADLINSLEVNVINNAFFPIQTGIHYGGNGGCACYNYSFNNWVGGSTGVSNIGFEYDQTASFNQSYRDHVHGLVSKAFYIHSNAGALQIHEANVETFGAGIAFDIAGQDNYIDGSYVEGGPGGTDFKFEPTATQNTVIGNLSVSVTTPTDYTTADKTTNWVFNLAGQGTGGQPVVPQFQWGNNYYTTSGSDASYYTWAADTLASGVIGTGMFYTAGRTPETGAFSGRNGHAGLAVGELTTTGGAAFKGAVSTTIISTPGTPTCTATCAGTCTTTYSYAVVCHDFTTYSLNSGSTTKSATATCSNNATLDSVSNFNTVTWPKQDGCTKWDLVGNQDLTHSVMTNQGVSIPGSVATPGTTYSYKDFNNSPSAYTPPTRNSTADVALTGQLGLGTTTFAGLGMITAGQHIFCSDCKNSVDNAVSVGAVCAGSGNGALAIRINSTNRCY